MSTPLSESHEFIKPGSSPLIIYRVGRKCGFKQILDTPEGSRKVPETELSLLEETLKGDIILHRV